LSRVGIYGGTFDPIHLGHLHVITQLFKKDLIDQLFLIPAGQPQEIKNKVSVNPIEILRQGPSYAIDTVEALHHAYPEDELFLVLGADAYAKINQWERVDELKDLVSIICINRPGYPATGIDIEALDAAATSIRQGLSADVPEIVAGFIRENGLYDNQ